MAKFHIERKSKSRMTPEEFSTMRKLLGLTQIELAKKFGIAQSSVSHFETGRWKIPKLVALALSLLVEIDYSKK